jgi:UDP-2,4-diacetamido-2,4,6-trideoxy-beta-L-altropyranose hydrolase
VQTWLLNTLRLVEKMALGAILIRADASPEIGTGHVMRCLALAQAWQDAGGRAVFAMAHSFPALEARLTAEEFAIVGLSGMIHRNEDARRTQEIAKQLTANWVVVDGYQFDANYQLAIKDAGVKLLFLDDIAHCTSYAADLVLNQNIHANEDMYMKRESYTRCLMGPRFALLRHEFARRDERDRDVREIGKNILVLMGGSDPGNATAKVMDAIGLLHEEDLRVTVVAGPGTASLQTLAKRRPHRVTVVRSPQSLAELMASADLAVSAAGSTVWELCHLGLPAILVAVAENQLPGARELGRRGIFAYLGHIQNVEATELASEIRALLRSQERRKAMSEMGRNLVDGRGCKRVLNALNASGLKLRRATAEDSLLLWRWVNDAEVRAASFQSKSISKEEHATWFEQKLSSSHAAIYIAEDDQGIPVGQFRVEWAGGGLAEVDISVAPEKRGAGIAPSLIRDATYLASQDMGLKCFQAHIKAENRASLRAFEKAGFSNFEQIADSVCCRKEIPQ